ncbi:MAG: hypothetical protein WC299_14205, partial [Kiritimatiellia bacterium]
RPTPAIAGFATAGGWIFAEPCEATEAIHPCGKPQGFLAKKVKIEVISKVATKKHKIHKTLVFLVHFCGNK